MNSVSNNRVAIITGAGSGIGKHTALRFLEDGYNVVMAGRRLETLERTKKESKHNGSRVLLMPTDVSDPNSIRQLFSKTTEQYGRLDVLFNNAGIGSPRDILFEDLDFAQWKAVVDTNLTGSFVCSQEAFKLMKSQTPMGGRIINNGSISAHVPRPNSAPYTSTKHAITGLTKATSLDGRKYNIACGQIDIGNAHTAMTARSESGTAQANGTIMVEPTMDVDNVAKAVLYMASLPLDTNVQFMTVMATTMPYIGRG